MEQENFPHQESEFDKLLKSKEAEGWYYVGREGLTRERLSEKTKFEAIPFQTEDKIREKHLQLAGQQDPSSEFEVDLVLDENTDKLRRFREISTEEEYHNILSNLREADKVYFVFVRKIAK